MVKEKQEYFKLKRIHVWQGLTGLFAVLLIISISTSGFSSSRNKEIEIKGVQVEERTPPTAPTAPSKPTTVTASVDDDAFLGDENAPVTIVEFSDFQCPFCKRFNDQTFDQIKEQYIDTGKVKWVFRDFPLSNIHPNAQKAAEAAECAEEQDKFWEFHDVLFEKQSEWSSGGPSKFSDYASDLGLNVNDFEECLNSNKYAEEVQNDLKGAASAGGRGTPYFVVNDKAVSGAQPFSAFQAAIEAELN